MQNVGVNSSILNSRTPAAIIHRLVPSQVEGRQQLERPETVTSCDGRNSPPTVTTSATKSSEASGHRS